MLMNEQQWLDNYLLLLKSTVEVYVHGTLESSNNSIRKVLKYGLDETMTNQANTYDEMTKCGWYKVNNTRISQINQVLRKVTCQN